MTTTQRPDRGSSAAAPGEAVPRRRPPARGRGRVALAGWIVAGLALLVASLVVALTIGPANSTAAGSIEPLRPADVLASAAHHVREALATIGLGGDPGPGPLSAIREAIVWQGRAPRILVAVFVGSGLALAGAVMQSVTRNPLADPYLLGLSSGASLGAVLVLLLGVGILLPVAAFAGAMAALLLTLSIGGGSAAPHRLVLAGVAVAQGLSALVSFAIFTTARGDSYRDILGWLLGSLSGATWAAVAIAAAATILVGAVLVASARTLDSFAFGEVTAASLGVRVVRSRWLLLTASALLTGALVSVSGSIGFVGLVLPHMVRLVAGTRHRVVLPLAALGGGIFLLWADTAARTLFAPLEVPVGILTAAIGAPVFAVLLARRRRGGGR
ncbi:iron chelate uptake ABC transporter family permease subunit [Pseudactinotalea sp. HY160]|uniref:iron chelate uptake ABC transporter family permease subunit n=1 Tax=Pseudactinotalea sp. HY160 TaxID=2654490 RepID=UPI00128E7828|nr:iron chelate uptake ABC transporter family permease subunit [Pseudactinotalea sp. HY160]MPV49652.1 iron chelate uptake ABC transporter family permease subunit [Pseudactinotalea sp. HY160]